jgi:hypothetical protein
VDFLEYELSLSFVEAFNDVLDDMGALDILKKLIVTISLRRRDLPHVL